ncbi:uncharacterized protein CEXT_365011 [Caerostris extrusa]|uniref:Uncharacterized protein n=1 Tax=Caerostris extrusa TaxID=172846 RepID=A0AAV4T1M6_CAEEX|nr:uncharacterized protein CEXT_365011 [Caerostris extrusa]
MNKNKIRYNYGRRRSRSLGGLLNARDICKTIEKSVLPSQRLQLLLEYAIEHGLSKAEKNLDEDIDYDEFRKSISICQVKIESDIEEMNYCSLAVSKDENGELNLNNSLNEKYNSYSSAVAKLEEENKQWDNLLTKYRTNLEKEIK